MKLSDMNVTAVSSRYLVKTFNSNKLHIVDRQATPKDTNIAKSFHAFQCNLNSSNVFVAIAHEWEVKEAAKPGGGYFEFSLCEKCGTLEDFQAVGQAQTIEEEKARVKREALDEKRYVARNEYYRTAEQYKSQFISNLRAQGYNVTDKGDGEYLVDVGPVGLTFTIWPSMPDGSSIMEHVEKTVTLDKP